MKKLLSKVALSKVWLISIWYQCNLVLGTTNGISMGATTVSMPIAYKWLMIAAMTIGRVEIMSVIIALSPYKTKE